MVIRLLDKIKLFRKGRGNENFVFIVRKVQRFLLNPDKIGTPKPRSKSFAGATPDFSIQDVGGWESRNPRSIQFWLNNAQGLFY